jgi:large subunit ribosomal protein L24
MKLRRDDKVMVITGKDRGKTGTVTRVLPKDDAVVVDGINVVKRHTKPSNKFPQGGIREINKPIATGKVMVIDPATGAPSRVGFRLNADGSKERVFKASRYEKTKKDTAKASKSKPAAKKAATKGDN